MTKVRLCFEVDGLAEDEHGNPGPCGLAMTIEIENLDEPPAYEKLAAAVNIPGVLKEFCLDGIVKPEDVRIITPEEYEERYGDEE